MSRGPSLFKQRDVTRAIRAAQAAGVEARVEIKPDGTIAIVPAKPIETSPADDNEPNEWDEAT